MSMELPGLGNVSVSVLSQITQSCLIGIEIGEASLELETTGGSKYSNVATKKAVIRPDSEQYLLMFNMMKITPQLVVCEE